MRSRFAVAVLVVMGTVLAYMSRHRSPWPRGWRAPAAVLVTVTSAMPFSVYTSLVGVWLASRGYHCGDELNIHAANVGMQIVGYLVALVAPGVVAGLLTWSLLRVARRLWFAAQPPLPRSV